MGIVYSGPAFDFSSFYDPQKERVACWQAARELAGPRPPAALVGFADRAEENSSSALLDRAERKFFGEVLTAGTWPKRQRFWRFVSMQARGITPRDLREPGEKSPRQRRRK